MSTKPGTTIDIIRFRGDTYDQAFRLTSNNLPFDLTGCTSVLTVVEPAKKGTLDYVFQTVGAPVDDPTDGILSFPITESDVAVEGTYEYDVQITDSNGKIKTHISGKWKLYSDVNRGIMSSP